jgi:hypothetical protein
MDDDYFGPIDAEDAGSTAVTLGSRMNRKNYEEGPKNNDLYRNADFSEETPF